MKEQTVIETGSLDSVTRVATLEARPDRVWRALTDHVEFGQWFEVRLDGPFVVGQVTRGSILTTGYEGLPWAARVERMDPERTFAFRWHPYDFEASPDDETEPTTLVEFRLEPAGDGTRLTITESGFAALPEPRRLEALRQNGAGWTVQAGNIARHVGG